MSYKKYSLYSIILTFLLLILQSTNTLYCQKIDPATVNSKTNPFKFLQETVDEHQKSTTVVSEPDTNFTWEKYATFLNKISDTSKYTVLPLNEFRQTFNNRKVVIGLRHDVDIDLNVAYNFSKVESDLGFRATYFILHTAPYYLQNSNNMEVHNNEILPILKSMQNERHFEIGWHNDLVTLQVIYNINPVTFLHNELNWLRSNGIKIFGTAAHGSNYCKTYHYLNYYFFEECSSPVVLNRENNKIVPKDGKSIKLLKAKLSDFNLQYEAYFLNNNKAFSDATVTNGIRWNIGMLDLKQLKPGDRVIILLHPIHWHKASVKAKIESFNIPGQISSTIDTIDCKVVVEMHGGTKRSSLIPSFSLSPGAYAKVAGKMQFSRNTANNFTNAVTYRVYAENRSIYRDWTVIVHTPRGKANFVTFMIPGGKGKSLIDTVENTIKTEIRPGFRLDSLTPSFSVSDNSRVWIDDREQVSDSGYTDFSNPVIYKVITNDGTVVKKWKVIIKASDDGSKDKKNITGLTISPNPTDGKTDLHFSGVASSPSTIEIFDTMGNKVHSKTIQKTGEFTIREDLKKLNGGVYIVRYSELEQPEIIVVKQH